MALECLEPATLVDTLGLIGEQHGIPIEGKTQLTTGRPMRAARQDSRRGKARVEGAAHILGMSGEK